MSTANQESHPLHEIHKSDAKKVVELGQKLIGSENLVQDDQGFYTCDVPMESHINPDGETFIQACGSLASFGIEGVYFPEVEEEELPETFPSAEEIMNMSKSRRVSWNPIILKEFIGT